MSLNLADVLSRLDHPRPTANGWEAPCPAHHDSSPSLAIAQGHTRPVVMYCFAGCSREAILRALGLSDEPHTTAGAYTLTEEQKGRQDAIRRALRAPWRRPDNRLLYAASDLYRQASQTVRDLNAAAERLGPDDPAAWDMLERAARLEGELRLLEMDLDALP